MSKIKVGDKVVIIDNDKYFYSNGDIAVVESIDVREDGTVGCYYLDFNNQGNKEVCGDGKWFATPERIRKFNKWTDTPVGSTFTTKSGKVIKVFEFGNDRSGYNCDDCYLNLKPKCNGHYCTYSSRLDCNDVTYIKTES